MSRGSHAGVVGGLIIFAGSMFALPLFVRDRTPALDSSEKPLTGSQRMRGVFINAGSKDVGADPDWDPVTKTYLGWEKKERKRLANIAKQEEAQKQK